MIATLQAIYYYLIELLTPPEIMQVRLNVNVFQKYCCQLVTKMVTPFQAMMWFHNTIPTSFRMCCEEHPIKQMYIQYILTWLSVQINKRSHKT